MEMASGAGAADGCFGPPGRGARRRAGAGVGRGARGAPEPSAPTLVPWVAQGREPSTQRACRSPGRAP